MVIYQWKGIQGSEVTNGEIEARNSDEASNKLKEKKIIATNIVLISGKEEATPQAGAEELKESGIADNTMVLFISDHQSRGKLTVYEGHRAPAIIHWPGKTKNASIEEGLCSNIDILPTLLDLAGGKPRAGAITDGKSLIPLLKGDKPADWRQSILLETSYSRAVVSDDWKYIANRPPQKVLDKMEEDRIKVEKTGGRRHVGWSGRTTNAASGMGVRFNADQDFPCYFDRDQLYNLGDDVFEQKNLVTNPEHENRLDELKKHMSAELDKLPHHFGEFGTRGTGN